MQLSLNQVHKKKYSILNHRKESMDSNHFVLLWENIQRSRAGREERERNKNEPHINKAMSMQQIHFSRVKTQKAHAGFKN